MKLMTSIAVLALGISLVTVDCEAASRRAKPASKPRGVLVSDPNLIFEVTDSGGKSIKCLLSTPPAAGTTSRVKNKTYFVRDSVTVKEKIKKIKAAIAAQLKKAKTKKQKAKLRAKQASQIAALNSSMTARNTLCAGATETPGGNGENPLEVACVDLTPYDGPWGEAQVDMLFEKTAWAATIAEKAEGASMGLNHTVDNMLLRKNGKLTNAALEERIYDWQDGTLGNLTGNDPQGPNDFDNDGFQYQLADYFLFDKNKFHTHMLHKIMQQVAASYRVLGGDERHAFVGYMNKLKDFVNTGNYRRLIEEMSHDHLYSVRWLNLEASKVESPNEDFARELMQLASAMGQFNMCDPNRGLNYNDQDIAAVAKVLAGKYRTTYDNSLERRVLAIVPSASYNGQGGSPLTVGAGTPWQTTILNEEDVVRMILSRRETACGIANWLIQDALGLYREPPALLVQRVANMVFEDNFNVYTRAVPTLMKSRAMFSSCAKKSQAKDPAEFVISFVQKTGIPVSSRNVEDKIADLGMSLGNPATVFGWSYAASFSSRQLTAREDTITEIIADEGYHCPGPGAFTVGNQRYDRERNASLYPACFLNNQLFPKAAPTEAETIEHVCGRILGVSLSSSARDQLVGYANFRRRNDGTLERRSWDTYEAVPIEPYNNIQGSTRYIWQPKVNGFLAVCSGLLDFQTK